MQTVIDAQSTLTDRYQTTIPESVRLALKLNKRDKIQYEVKSNGEVVLSRISPAEEDPVVDKLLEFLEADMLQKPERLQALDSGLLNQLDALVGQVEVDLEVPLSADDE